MRPAGYSSTLSSAKLSEPFLHGHLKVASNSHCLLAPKSSSQSSPFTCHESSSFALPTVKMLGSEGYQTELSLTLPAYISDSPLELWFPINSSHKKRYIISSTQISAKLDETFKDRYAYNFPPKVTRTEAYHRLPRPPPHEPCSRATVTATR